MKQYKPHIVLLLASFFLLRCDGGHMTENMTNYVRLQEVPAEKWESLSEKNIYFGHMSVGYNIIEGIKDIMKENPQIKLNIVESIKEDESQSGGGIFFHSRVGKNGEPLAKMKDFEKVLSQNNAPGIDIAMLKLCYVDFTSDSDLAIILKAYKETIQRIKNKHEKVQLIHFTVPLMKVQVGPKAWIKRIIGRKPYGVAENIKRQEYNQLLKKEFDGKDPIFDIALFESTYPDGRRATFNEDGQTYFQLVGDYTFDGGHLNPTGRKVVATQLLLMLVNKG